MKDFFRFRSELLEGKKDQNQTNEASTKELKDLDLGDDVMVNGKMGMFYGMQGSKVKVRFPSGQETVPAKDVEVMNLMMDDLDKDDDDPCWDGYVQVGTKMKNGKEVPNCVPMEEARKQMKNESVLNEGSADTKRFMKQIVRAFKPISRKEKIAKTFSYKPGKDYASVPVIITYNKSEDEYASYIWSPRLKDMLHHDFYGDLDDAVDDAKFEIKDDIDRGGEFVPGRQRLRMGESVKNEDTRINEMYYDAPDYGPINEAKVTDDHWAIVKRNGSFYSGKSEILKIVKPDLRGNPPSMKMINTYGGDSAVKVGELKKALKGKRNTDKLMKQLTESKTVEVSVRDARKANDIASDMFRGEYKTDGSNTFVFKKADAADDFRAELKKQRIELLEGTVSEAFRQNEPGRVKFRADGVAGADGALVEFGYIGNGEVILIVGNQKVFLTKENVQAIMKNVFSSNVFR